MTVEEIKTLAKTDSWAAWSAAWELWTTDAQEGMTAARYLLAQRPVYAVPENGREAGESARARLIAAIGDLIERDPEAKQRWLADVQL